MNRNTLPPIGNYSYQPAVENGNYSNSYQIIRSQTPILDNQNSIIIIKLSKQIIK